MKETLKLVIEAMEKHGDAYLGHSAEYYWALEKAKEALAKQEQGEPVATDADREFWLDVCENLDKVKVGKSPTDGMTLGERIAHVGGRENAAGYIEFGSAQAVKALIEQVLRDTTPQQRKPLTDEQLMTALLGVDHETKRLPSGFRAFARAIEAAHGIKE